MIGANDADIVFFEQDLLMNGPLELFKISHGQIHVAGFERDAAHPLRRYLHGMNIDRRGLPRDEFQQFGQEYHLSKIAGEDPECAIGRAGIESELPFDGVAHFAPMPAERARREPLRAASAPFRHWCVRTVDPRAAHAGG